MATFFGNTEEAATFAGFICIQSSPKKELIDVKEWEITFTKHSHKEKLI